MTNDAIRRKIAEACGWSGIVSDTQIGRLWGTKFPTRAITEIPNYTESHDAMQEALETLSVGERLDVAVQLSKMKNQSPTHAFLYSSVTEQAEAFLRAKGLWEDGE